MSPWLVWLPAAQAAPEQALTAWVQTPDGAVQVQQAPLAQLSRGGRRQVVVVVPAQQLSWHVLQVPAGVSLRGDSRLLPVLQNLLEDHVLDDADAVHVALAPEAAAGHGALVAVCDQAWLRAWLQQFEAAGWQVLRVLPEAPPDAWPQAALCTGTAHAAWVSTVVDGLPLSVPLEAEGSTGVAGQSLPAQVWALPGAYADAARCWGPERVQLLPEADYVQALLASRWELAQHSLAANPAERFKRKAAAAWGHVMTAPQWRWARWGCVAWAAALVLGLHAQAWWQARSLEAKRDAVVHTAQAAFPQLRVVVDAPLQMQRELQRLRLQAGVLEAGDLLPMLSAVGAALQGHAVQALEYQPGELLLRGVPAAAVPDVATKLQGSGYVLEPAGDAVRVRVEKL